MSGLIRWNLSANITNGSYVDSFTPTPTTITQTGQGAAGGVVSVATGGTTLDVGSVTTLGYLFLINLDTTNYVTWGVSGTQIGKLFPGEPAMLRLNPGITFTLTAHTATVAVQYLLLQN